MGKDPFHHDSKDSRRKRRTNTWGHNQGSPGLDTGTSTSPSPSTHRKSLPSHLQTVQLLQACRGALFLRVGDEREPLALPGFVPVQDKLSNLSTIRRPGDSLINDALIPTPKSRKSTRIQGTNLPSHPTDTNIETCRVFSLPLRTNDRFLQDRPP